MPGAIGVTSYRPLPGRDVREGIHLTRRDWLWPFLIAGVACVIGGGALAAATAYVTTQKLAWATAYLVLVGGVAQIGLGGATAWLAPVAPRQLAWWSFACWNLGNAGVLAGQLAGLLILTDVGTVLLIIALVLVLIAGRSRHLLRTAVSSSSRGGSSGKGSSDNDGSPPGAEAMMTDRLEQPHPAVLYVFRGLLIVLAVTVPIGIVLAHLGK